MKSLKGRKSSNIILILALVSAFAPLATDMYLPGFEQMAEHFEVSSGRIEATLSVFFLGLTLGQVLYGPLVDRYGRRGPLLAGIGLYVLATMGCLLTRDATVFIGMRFLQAIGGCAGMIVARAMVNDLYKGAESARVLSLLMIMMALAPIVAPLLGAWILLVANWKGIFIFMLAFGLLCAVLVVSYIPETLQTEDRKMIRISTTLRTYAALFRQRAFILPALAGGLAQTCLFSFITGSPFVMMGLFGLNEQQYSWIFAIIAAGLIVGAQINRMCLRRWSVKRLLGLGLCVNLVAGLVMAAMVVSGSLVLFLVPLWFVIASLGLISGNAAAMAMEASGKFVGSGSALVGILQFGFAFLVSSLVAAAQNGTAYPMSTAIIIAGFLANAVWLWFLPTTAMMRSRNDLR